MKAYIFILVVGGAIAREVTVPTSLKVSVFGKLNFLFEVIYKTGLST
jgi:hypothetical protein